MNNAAPDSIAALSEHQAAPTDATPANYEPTPDERKAVKKAEKLFERYRTHRNNYDADWMDNYRFYRGRQWQEIRPSYRHSEVLNVVFQAIQSQVPILTDARPKFEYLPQEPSDREFAEMINEIAKADWEAKNWLYKLTEVLYDGHIYGTGISKMVFDEELRGGAGDIDYRSEEIFYCYPDPDSEDVNERSRGFIRAEPMPLAEIKRRWPNKGKYVKEEIQDLLDGTKNDLDPLRFRNPKGDKTMVENSSLHVTENEKKALVKECFFFDDDFTEEEKKEIDAEGNETTVFEQRLKYPHGRRLVVAGNVVLEDGPNPYADGEWPWQRWCNYILPREFWGESEIAQIRGPQKIINKIYSFVLDVLTLTGNPIWVVDASSGVDADMLTNAPGLVVEKNPGTEVRREAGTQLQPYVIQILDRVKESLDQIAGAQDITRGIPSGGVTAASAIADLQNAAQTRMRQKARNLDAYLQNLGEQYLSRVMQFYTAPRMFHVTGNDGVRRYFRAHLADGENGPTAQVQRFDEDGRPQAPETYELRGKLDVRVTTGTALPFSKAQKKDELLALLDRGVIDREEYFKQTEYPNWEAVEQRMQEREAAAAQAAAQEQAQA